MVAFWGLVVWGIVALVRGVPAGRRQMDAEPDAERPSEILRHRLARGEISAEQYDHLRELLSEDERVHSRA
jgi:uncharacterized membrane protein